jgi:predicted enzyme related to lactoylglutathione lyase
MPPQLGAVYYMLAAQDMDRAVAFWRDAIGLDVKSQSPGWSELTFPGLASAVVALHAGGSGELNRTGLGFDVADIAAACAEVERAGGRVTMPPTDRPDEGIVLADLVDPEGNTFMFSARFGGSGSGGGQAG